MEQRNTGTTIGCFFNKNTGSWIVFADTQLTEGNFRIMPELFPKIFIIGNNILMACTGSVGDVQNLSDRIIRNVLVEQILAGDMEGGFDLEICIKKFANELSKNLFDLKLDKNITDLSSNFLLVGYSKEKQKSFCYSVATDGAKININNFYSDGSGSNYCLPQLSNLWENNESMKDIELAEAIESAVMQTSKLDLFTNNQVQILILKKDGTISEYTHKK